MNYLLKAIKNLRPNSSFSIEDTYDSLKWFSEDFPPTKKEVEEEILRLENEYKKTKYKELRKNEYPDIIEYIDGVVKGDQQQIQNYINKCLEVKKKYPKSEGTE
jgi:hypothetical protein